MNQGRPGTSIAVVPPARLDVLDPEVRPIAMEITEYMLFKRKRLTAKSDRGYRAILKEFVGVFSGYTLSDFYPPAGGQMIEEFLERRWGGSSPRTYNKGFSVIHGFFDWELRRGRIPGDPMMALEKAKVRPYQRTTFSDQQRAAVMLAATEPRDRIALKLLFDYGIRKGALMNVRIGDFDIERRRITIFTKGETIQEIPLPDESLWADLAALGEPDNYYLIPRQVQRRRRPLHRAEMLRLRELLDEAHALALIVENDSACEREASELATTIDLAAGWLDRSFAAASVQVRRFHDEPIGEHGLHDLWYRWLARAGIVPRGITRGTRMHSARHTAAQRLLDLTGNMKAVQTLLGHRSLQVTELYVGFETSQLERDLREVIARDRTKETSHA